MKTVCDNQEVVFLYREKIETMAVVSMDKCRRDTLWNRLLMMNFAEEQISKRKSDADKRDVSTMLLNIVRHTRF